MHERQNIWKIQHIYEGSIPTKLTFTQNFKLGSVLFLKEVHITNVEPLNKCYRITIDSICHLMF